MLDSLQKMWANKEIRKKLIYTFLMLLLYRLVSVIPRSEERRVGKRSRPSAGKPR